MDLRIALKYWILLFLILYLVEFHPHSVHSLFCWGRSSYQIFKKVGLTGSQLLEGVAEKEGSEKNVFFSALTKDLNWEDENF